MESKRQKTAVISIYICGNYLCTARKDMSELPLWQKALGEHNFKLEEDNGIAAYYRVDIWTKYWIQEKNDEQVN